VPATLYGAGMDPISVQAEAKNLQNVLHQARATALVDVTIEGGDTYQVLFRQPVYHPVNDTLTHVDLMRVSSTALVRLEVPIELTGNAKGVLAGGILDHVLHSLEIECQAIAIPDRVAVDVSGLEIGDHVTVGELKLEGVKILTAAAQTIATLSAPRAEEAVPDDGESKEAEPEVVKRKKATEDDEM